MYRGRGNGHRGILHTLNQRWWTEVVLLDGMARAQSEKCCGWSIICKSPNSLDSRDRFVSNILGADVPSPGLPLKK